MKINNEIVKNHGLTKDEYKKIITLLEREPNMVELGIFSAMWNEHCSYKSSKHHLKTLPTKNNNVIQGPGENAGVIDIGDEDALVFKIESHNHPSFIEPYQGAATGVGGILRDVFTMGARPIALLNSIHFGDPKNDKTKNLLNGVVSGIVDMEIVSAYQPWEVKQNLTKRIMKIYWLTQWLLVMQKKIRFFTLKQKV